MPDSDDEDLTLDLQKETEAERHAMLREHEARLDAETIKRQTTRELKHFFLSLSAKGLRNLDAGMFTSSSDKSDPYFKIKVLRDTDEWEEVYRSARIDNDLNPNWPEMSASMFLLCDNDELRPLIIEVP